jgi:citrate lyase beta subunit
LRFLSVPASNFGMVEKAFASNVDAVLFDLEDAVAPSDTFSYSANS